MIQQARRFGREVGGVSAFAMVGNCEVGVGVESILFLDDWFRFGSEAGVLASDAAFETGKHSATFAITSTLTTCKSSNKFAARP